MKRMVGSQVFVLILQTIFMDAQMENFLLPMNMERNGLFCMISTLERLRIWQRIKCRKNMRTFYIEWQDAGERVIYREK